MKGFRSEFWSVEKLGIAGSSIKKTWKTSVISKHPHIWTFIHCFKISSTIKMLLNLSFYADSFKFFYLFTYAFCKCFMVKFLAPCFICTTIKVLQMKFEMFLILELPECWRFTIAEEKLNNYTIEYQTISDIKQLIKSLYLSCLFKLSFAALHNYNLQISIHRCTF
jgi:hypothetical protein